MTPHQLRKLDHALTTFVDFSRADRGRPERRHAMGQYVKRLLLDGERKSVFPMAERLAEDPGDVQGLRQRLLCCVRI